MSKISFPGGGGGGGGAGVSDHGGLAGLIDDDHSQYLMGDYSRSSDHVYAASGHIVSGLAIGASGKIRLVDYAFIVETAGVSGLAVRRSDGRVGIASPTTLSSALTIGGDGVVSLVGTTPKIDSAGNLTFEDGGGGSFTSHTTTSFRINNNDLGGLCNLITDTVTKPALTVRAMAGQTANSISFENVGGNLVGQVSSGGAIGASGGITVNDNILPSASGEVSLGVASQPFASGIFNDGFYIRGQDDGQSPGFTRNGWAISVKAMNGNATNLEANSYLMQAGGTLVWTGFGQLASALDGVIVAKNAAGTASGVFSANSGVFASGVRMRAPNGSGWALTVDDAGGLTTTGPSVWTDG